MQRPVLRLSLGDAEESDTAAPSAEASGETASTQQEQTADDKKGESVTLRFAWWGGDDRHTATLKAIEEYQKINPNVKIEAEYQGYDGYNDKILTQADPSRTSCRRLQRLRRSIRRHFRIRL